LLMPQSYLTPDLTCCRRQSRGRKYEWGQGLPMQETKPDLM